MTRYTVYKTRQLWQAVVTRSTEKFCCHVAYKPLPVTHARDYATVEFCVRQMTCSLLLLEIIWHFLDRLVTKSTYLALAGENCWQPYILNTNLTISRHTLGNPYLFMSSVSGWWTIDRIRLWHERSFVRELFADDVKVYIRVLNNCYMQQLQRVLDTLANWRTCGSWVSLSVSARS